MSAILFALLWPPLYTAAGVLACRKAGPQWWTVLLPGTVSWGLLCAGFGAVVAGTNAGEWLAVAIGVAWMGLGALLWWWRRKRRRTMAMLGAKSKALIAAMVKRARSERRPGRVLQPGLVPS
jgi:hypothetical protein